MRRPTGTMLVYLGFVLIFVVFAVILRDKGFLTIENQLNILRQTAVVSIMAFGMTYALSVGEIDLSIGSVVGLTAMVTATSLLDANAVVAVAAGLGVGVLVGIANGVMTIGFRVPSFLITLGTGSIAAGLARQVNTLQSLPVVDQTYTDIFGGGSLGPIPSLALWTFAVLILAHAVYRKSVFGTHVLAVGGNREAARRAGINTSRVRITALVICSVTAALAGILYAGYLHSARSTLGSADLLTVIAASVIGGTKLDGGRGTIIGALLGSLVMGVLNNGLFLMGFTSTEQAIARGVIIIIAVALSLREG